MRLDFFMSLCRQFASTKSRKDNNNYVKLLQQYNLAVCLLIIWWLIVVICRFYLQHSTTYYNVPLPRRSFGPWSIRKLLLKTAKNFGHWVEYLWLERAFDVKVVSFIITWQMVSFGCRWLVGACPVKLKNHRDSANQQLRWCFTTIAIVSRNNRDCSSLVLRKMSRYVRKRMA